MLAAFTWSPDAVWIFTQKVWMVLARTGGFGLLPRIRPLFSCPMGRREGAEIFPRLRAEAVRSSGRRNGILSLGSAPGRLCQIIRGRRNRRVEPGRQTAILFPSTAGSKFLIVAAGPGFNFLLTFLIFTGWLSTGSPLFMPTFRELTPEVEALRPGSPGEIAGLQIRRSNSTRK